ncbi:MAG: STM4012 family radical SAM protein [Myxococcota bacterium]|nr:STM4012 family radical SAM protein [Myxococcota bacterium]
MLDGSRYQAYVYAYPHKTAYRPIEPALPLGPLWAHERRDALFLYVHVPFCEQRCGFCNLFTQPVPEAERIDAYLGTLERQVRVVRRALDEGGPFAIARAAIGGGTPTLLDAGQLERLFAMCRTMGYGARVPLSVETSPETALPDRLAVLVGHGADRISMGVQSFVDAEVKAVNRPQQVGEVHRAIRAIRDAGPANLNLDLMYGLPGQTAETWEHSLASALEYRPEELYLYPLYVRPLTTLGRKQVEAQDRHRVELYDQAGDRLRGAGYRQVSMRMWRRADAASANGPVYCCQGDGMIGLGVGARSYTRTVHYSSEWGVGARSVRGIIDRWITRTDEELAVADYGFVLDAAEQRRRWLILSLLSDEGLDVTAYAARFGSDPFADAPALAELEPRGFAHRTTVGEAVHLVLTPEGLARADAIGPWLFSDAVTRQMASYELT